MFMKSIIAILLTAALGFIAGKFLPWWSIAIVAFLVALLLQQSLGKGFLSGFLGIFLLWGVLALWIDLKNSQVLSQQVAKILPLGGSSILLVLITALIGALVGGFAAFTGSAVFPAKRNRRY
jgi:hypothetical protein